MRQEGVTRQEKEALIGNVIRVNANEEFENYFDVYGEPDTEEERQEIINLIDRCGLWTVYSEYKCPCCGQYVIADSIGMCIYDDPTDPKENEYVNDLIDSAIEQYNQAVANH